MNLNNLIILNWCERPCAKLVCRVFPNKSIKYVNKDLRKYYKRLKRSEGWATLNSFGFVKNGDSYVLKNPSKVKYPDGKICNWQGKTEFTYNEIMNMKGYD